MKVLRFILFFASFIGQCDAPDTIRNEALQFDKHWNVYIRSLFGCPEIGDTTAETCTLPKIVDYGEFLKARNEAKKVFDLYEPTK